MKITLGSVLNLEDFIVRFMHRMRVDDRIKIKPSFRQSFAIGELLLARFLRQEKLAVPDLVQSVVNTSYYEDQSVAHEIALDLLNSILGEHMIDPKIQYHTKALIKAVEINNYLGDYAKDEKVLQDLFKVDFPNLENLMSLVDVIFNAKKDTNALKDLEFYNSRGQLERLLPEIKDKAQQIYAKKLLDQPEWQNDLEQLMHEDLMKFAEVTKNLQSLGMTQAQLDRIMEKAVQQAQNLQQYEELLSKSEAYQPPSSLLKEQITKENVETAIKTGQNLEKKFPHQAMKDIFNTMQEKGLDLNMENLMDSYHEEDNWKEALESYINKKLQNTTAQEKHQIAEHLKQHAGGSPIPDFQQFIQKMMQKMADGSLEDTTQIEQFLDLIQEFNEQGIPLDSEKAQNKAQQLGMGEEALNNMVPTNFSQLRNQLRKGKGNFQSFQNALQNMQLSPEEEAQLTEEAIQNGTPELLGALGHKNLKRTIEQMVAKGKTDRMDMLMQGLAKGPGPNLLAQWYNAFDVIPPEMRSKMQNLLKMVLLDLSMYQTKNYFGFIKEGHVKESHELRVFMDGDAMENVDLEETMLNLIDQGKMPEQLGPADILCHQEKEGELKVLLILDFSGSMSGERITNSIIACMALLQVMHSNEISVVVFESNTKIVKDFDTKTNIDQLSVELLNLKAQGGTQITRSLEYIIKCLEKAESEQILFTCILSDFAVYETDRELIPLLQRMRNNNLRLNLISTPTPEKKTIDLFKRYLELKHTIIQTPQQISQLIAELLYEIR